MDTSTDTSTDTFDLTPATRAMADVVRGVPDDRMGGPTPCPAYTVADLAEHVASLTVAFTHSARRTTMPSEPGDGDGSRLADGWRDQVVADLAGLAEAWRDPGAWQGTTVAGPIEMPAPEAALVALDELVVHGWDLAVSTGQAYDPAPGDVEACQAFVDGFDFPANDDGGLFGPPVEPRPGASALERLLASTGRDPGWSPA